jgi:hypothetical protein
MEKPLHVRVAEALGWTECEPFEAWGVVDTENWRGESPVPDPKSLSGFVGGFVPRYDTDWSATGPLIERLGITLERSGDKWIAWGEDYICTNSGEHEGTSSWDGEECWFPSPLVAVCKLILALHEAGKLPLTST